MNSLTRVGLLGLALQALQLAPADAQPPPIYLPMLARAASVGDRLTTWTPTASVTPTASATPTASVTPTATPRPSQTPTPGVSCRQLVTNPGFESRLSGWTVRGKSVTAETADDAAAGRGYVRILPEPNTGAFVESREIAALDASEVVSATLGWRLRGASTDPLEFNEILALQLEAVSMADCVGECWRTVDSRFNHNAPRDWTGSPADVTDWLRQPGVGAFRVVIGADASFVNPTRWDVDEVRLTVCARW